MLNIRIAHNVPAEKFELNDFRLYKSLCVTTD